MTSEEVVAAKRTAAEHWERLVTLIKKHGLDKVMASKQKTLVEEARANPFERNLALTSAAQGGEDSRIVVDFFMADESEEDRARTCVLLDGAHEIFRTTGKFVFYPWSRRTANQLVRFLTDAEKASLELGAAIRHEYRPRSVSDIAENGYHHGRGRQLTSAQHFYNWAISYHPEVRGEVAKAEEALDLEAGDGPILEESEELDLETGGGDIEPDLEAAPTPSKPTTAGRTTLTTRATATVRPQARVTATVRGAKPAKPAVTKAALIKRLEALSTTKAPADAKAMIRQTIDSGNLGRLEMADTLISAFEKV